MQLPLRPVCAVLLVLVGFALACSGSGGPPQSPSSLPSPGSASPGPPSAVEGYGTASVGGSGGDVFHVRTLVDDGPGGLREAILSRSGPRTVVFDVGGTITLRRDIVVNIPFITIDGSTAPAPGITIQQNTIADEFIVGGTHDVILSHLRFRGLYVDGGQANNNSSTINLDGDRQPDKVARRIVFDHLSVRASGDSGPDIYGNAEDVTISWCLIMDSKHPTTVSGPGTRQRISMHHNVYARNGERNPQVRADVRDLDYVNNIVAFWGAFPSLGSGYGVRLRTGDPEGKVNANILHNVFVPEPGRFTSWALVYGDRPGPSDDGGAGASLLGRVFVSGNILPASNQDHYSTVNAALAVPAAARVTTWPASELRSRVLPYVGMKHRDGDEEALLAQIGAAIPPG